MVASRHNGEQQLDPPSSPAAYLYTTKRADIRLEKDVRVKVALAIVVGVCGSAHATEWYMVGAREFRPVSSQQEWSTDRGRVYLEFAASEPWLYAPVRLPVGATVESLWCHVYDDSSDAWVSVVLEHHEHFATWLSVGVGNVLRASSSRPEALGAQVVFDVSAESTYAVIKDWDLDLLTTTYYTYYLRYVDNNACGAECGIYSCAVGYQP